MCQRYVLPDQAAAEHEFLPSTVWWKFAPRFNVAAAQYVPAVRLHQSRSEGVMLRWGFIPSWVEAESTGPYKTSVLLEQIEHSKIYRMPWLSSQRCILPVAGFYTWRLMREKYRQPSFVRLPARSVFGLAALWDRWVSPTDDVIESCSVICVPANDLVAGINDPDLGMPAILRRSDHHTWLHGTPVAARAALKSYDPRLMQSHAVSPRINASDVDDPALIHATG